MSKCGVCGCPSKYSPDVLAEKKKKKNQVLVLVNVTELASNIEHIINAYRYSCINKLLQVTANVLKFVDRLRGRCQEHPTLVLGLARKMRTMAVYHQAQAHPKFASWQKVLHLFYDSHGVIQWAGSLHNTDLSYSLKRPVFLGCRPSLHRAPGLAASPNCAVQRRQVYIDGTPIIISDHSRPSVCASFASYVSSLLSA